MVYGQNPNGVSQYDCDYSYSEGDSADDGGHLSDDARAWEQGIDVRHIGVHADGSTAGQPPHPEGGGGVGNRGSRACADDGEDTHLGDPYLGDVEDDATAHDPS